MSLTVALERRGGQRRAGRPGAPQTVLGAGAALPPVPGYRGAVASGTSLIVLFVRHLGPALVVLTGLVILAVDRSLIAAEGAAGIIGAGLAWWLFGWLWRQGEAGDHERDVEAAARDYLDEHGDWPTDRQTAYFARHGRWPDADRRAP